MNKRVKNCGVKYEKAAGALPEYLLSAIGKQVNEVSGVSAEKDSTAEPVNCASAEQDDNDKADDLKKTQLSSEAFEIAGKTLRHTSFSRRRQARRMAIR